MIHNSVDNLIGIKKEIQLKKGTQIIAVSKTFPIVNILPLINYGHEHYGENKVQEAIDKWTDIKIQNKNIKLHLIGKLQTNKVKFAVKIFDYIHSLDNEKLAAKIATEQIKHDKKIKIFIQINIGNEEQKSGIKKKEAFAFYKYCKSLNLNVIGIMCIPPQEKSSENYFLEMNKINQELNLIELSMGMSEDYLIAAKYNSTFLRIGSKIFGKRT
tara:strand:- start:294 stop:935 length:642 start_codon:yes stop_codon:yes gene_type:complete